MKYRKKPVEIEAEQFIKGQPYPSGMCTKMNCTVGPHVHTLEGHSYTLKYGDWVIKGVKGEFYPIDDDIFRETYEAVK